MNARGSLNLNIAINSTKTKNKIQINLLVIKIGVFKGTALVQRSLKA